MIHDKGANVRTYIHNLSRFFALSCLLGVGWSCGAPSLEKLSASMGSMATIQTPADNSTFTSRVVTFTWDNPNNETDFVLNIGTTAKGSNNLLANQPVTRQTTFTYNSMPDDGRYVFVRLQEGTKFQDYTYKSWTRPDPTFIYPTQGTQFKSRKETFAWSTYGADFFALNVSVTPLGGEILKDFPINSSTASETFTVSALPNDGRDVYVKLTVKKYAGGRTTYQKTFSLTTKAVDVPLANVIKPAPGSALPGTQVTFVFKTHGHTHFTMALGSQKGATDLGVHFHEFRTAPIPAEHSFTFSGLPTDGRDLHVSLGTKRYGGGTNSYVKYNYYTYQADAVNLTLKEFECFYDYRALQALCYITVCSYRYDSPQSFSVGVQINDVSRPPKTPDCNDKFPVVVAMSKIKRGQCFSREFKIDARLFATKWAPWQKHALTALIDPKCEIQEKSKSDNHGHTTLIQSGPEPIIRTFNITPTGRGQGGTYARIELSVLNRAGRLHPIPTGELLVYIYFDVKKKNTRPDLILTNRRFLFEFTTRLTHESLYVIPIPKSGIYNAKAMIVRRPHYRESAYATAQRQYYVP